MNRPDPDDYEGHRARQREPRRQSHNVPSDRQMGQMADWLRAHPVNDPANLAPALIAAQAQMGKAAV